MHETSPFAYRPLLTHRYDSASERFTVVADVGPASTDELDVFAGPRLVRLEIEVGGGTTSQSFRPPSDGCRFAGERRAVLHNGVLEVTVGVSRS